MTKRQIKYIKAWALDCQKPDAFKTTGYLTRLKKAKGQKGLVEADCCLGRACKLHKLKRKSIIENDIEAFQYEDKEDFDSGVLPNGLARKLGILHDGRLTEQGIETVRTYLKENKINKRPKRENCINLASLNDSIFAKDKTLYRIGKLIEFLAGQEEIGSKCFSQFGTI